MNEADFVGEVGSVEGTTRRTVLKGAGVGAIALAGVPAFAGTAAAKPGKGRGKGVGGGLVSHYPLNNVKKDGRVHDASPNRNDGTVVGDVSVGGGQVGNAYIFDGSGDYVAIPDDPSLGVENVTVSAWVNPAGANNREYVFDGRDHNYYVKELDNTERIEFGVFGGGSLRRVVSPAPLAPGAWHHLAGTYDGENVRLYVDGALVVASAFSPAPIDVSPGEARIGDYVGGGYGYDGMIDEVRVYDGALSAAEIASLAGQGGA